MRGLAEALVELAPEDLLERRLRARRLALGEGREHADAVGAHHLVLDQRARATFSRARAGEAAALLAARRASSARSRAKRCE